MSDDLIDRLRAMLDGPEPGMLAEDISRLFVDGRAFRDAVDWLAEIVLPHRPDAIAGIEARGFPFAAALAYKLGCGFIPVRKAGKLPPERVVAQDYSFEYGSGTLEMRRDLRAPGDRIALVDDLLATGGTLEAAVSLLRQASAEVVVVACIMELAFLGGRARLDVPVEALLRYDR